MPFADGADPPGPWVGRHVGPSRLSPLPSSEQPAPISIPFLTTITRRRIDSSWAHQLIDGFHPIWRAIRWACLPHLSAAAAGTKGIKVLRSRWGKGWDVPRSGRETCRRTRPTRPHELAQQFPMTGMAEKETWKGFWNGINPANPHSRIRDTQVNPTNAPAYLLVLGQPNFLSDSVST